jgi:uncharacterized membrane protein
MPSNAVASQAILWGCSILSIAIQCVFQVGWIRIWVRAVRGEKPSLGDMFGALDRLGALLVATLIMSIAIHIGMLLCLIPGIMLACGLLLTPYYVVDAKMGPFAALQASWQATKGQKWDILFFLIVVLGVLILGLLALGIGIFVAMPIVGLATTVIYLRLSGRAQAAPVTQLGAPMAGPYGAAPFAGYAPADGRWPRA